MPRITLEQCIPLVITVVRKYRGLTQVELADQARICQGEISNFENRSRIPNFKTQERLSEVLQIPAHILFDHWQDKYIEELKQYEPIDCD